MYSYVIYCLTPAGLERKTPFYCKMRRTTGSLSLRRPRDESPRSSLWPRKDDVGGLVNENALLVSELTSPWADGTGVAKTEVAGFRCHSEAFLLHVDTFPLDVEEVS